MYRYCLSATQLSLKPNKSTSFRDNIHWKLSLEAQPIELLSLFYNSRLSLIHNEEKCKKIEQKHVPVHNDLPILIDSFGRLSNRIPYKYLIS